MPDEFVRDEVSASDYHRACLKLEHIGLQLRVADADEAVQHWLPELTLATAIIFSFVGSNMTARHVPRYARTVAELQAAKDGVDSQPPTS